MIDYSTLIETAKKELTSLIEEGKKQTTREERKIHEFFERYPFALLSAISDVPSNHQVFGSLIISQPKFKSFNGDRSPDFLIVTWNSLNLFFNYIEIEDVTKPFFKGTSQVPAPEFFQAYNQLMQWSSFETEVTTHASEMLKTVFNENFNNTTDKNRHYNYVLLYGFSEELRSLGKRHSEIIHEYFKYGNKFHCTYSRLVNAFKFDQPLFSVKWDYTANKYRAIGFVPFKNYKVDDWSDFHNIIGKEELIQASNLMTEEEKKNIIEKIKNLDGKSLKEIIEINLADMGTNFFDRNL